MINFNKLESGKIYRSRTKYTLPYNEKSPMKGCLITVFGDSISDTTDFFKRPQFVFRRYNRYYIDRRINTKIINRQVRSLNNQEEIFENSFGAQFPVMLIRTIKAVNGYNVIYELNKYMEILDTDKRVANKETLQKANVKFNFIYDQLVSISSKFPDHKRKFLYLLQLVTF